MIKLNEIFSKTKIFLRDNWLILLLFCLVFVRTRNNSVIPLVRNAMARAPMVMSDNAAGAMEKKAKTPSINVNNSGQEKNDRKISKNVSINIEVRNTESAKKDLEKYLEENDGLIDNFYSYDFYNKISYNFRIKIPVEKLQDFLNFLKNKGTLKNESLSSTDKTDSYIDNKNRLENLYVRRDSLRKLMRTKAEQVADIISIEKELNNVQLEIERFERDNKKIQNSVDYSTVNLTVSPKVVLDANGGSWDFEKSLNNAVNIFIRFCQKTIDYVIILLMFTPLIIVLFFIYKVKDK
jgi:hypothetical protein